MRPATGRPASADPAAAGVSDPAAGASRVRGSSGNIGLSMAYREREEPFLRCLARVNEPSDPTLPHDHDPVAHRQHLRHLRRDENDRDAGPRELVDHPVDPVSYTHLTLP